MSTDIIAAQKGSVNQKMGIFILFFSAYKACSPAQFLGNVKKKM